MNSEEKEEHDKRVQRRDDAQAEISEYAALYRRARDPKKTQLWLERWQFEQMIFDLINDGLKGRYKTTLADRSWYEGSSRDGEGIECYKAWRKARNCAR